MTGSGLKEVPNPAGIFITDRQTGLSGSVVYPGMEGTRPLLLEIQALVVPNPNGSPAPGSLGFDNQRLAMILAVIEQRLGFKLQAATSSSMSPAATRRPRPRRILLSPAPCSPRLPIPRSRNRPSSWAKSALAAKSARSRWSSKGFARPKS